MSWFSDNWFWLLLLLLGGGGAAILALVPGALALVVSVWTMLPPKARWALGGVAAVIAGIFWGRQRGAANERAKNKERADNAVRNRLEVDNEVNRMSPSEVDKKLDQRGDFRD